MAFRRGRRQRLGRVPGDGAAAAGCGAAAFYGEGAGFLPRAGQARRSLGIWQRSSELLRFLEIAFPRALLTSSAFQALTC